MKTTKKTVMKKPAVKKMSTGGTTKKMSYGAVKPKALKKAELGMSMDSSGMDDSECYETITDAQGRPIKRRRRGAAGCGKKNRQSIARRMKN